MIHKNLYLVTLLLIVSFFMVFAPLLVTHNPILAKSGEELELPSAKHWLGTDRLGRDVWSRLIIGGQYTLQLSILATTISVLGGLSLASLSILPVIRVLADIVIDSLLSFPPIIVALFFRALLPSNVWTIGFVVGFSMIGSYARVAADAIAYTKRQPFMDSADSIGAPNWWIFLYYLVPNTMPTLASFAATVFAWSILYSASLSFLGLGYDISKPEWGLMIAQAQGTLTQAPHLVFLPSAMIVLCVWLSLRLADIMAAHQG